ncbi:MAG: type 4a pilus biogenesis protein PilO [Planctomycetaceae bacterium]|nr:type 4a pilus biogenesis protein PilO [Planctomycetaceae bacterium]
MKQANFLSGGWGAVVPLSAAIGAYLFFVFFPGMREIRELRADMDMKQAVIAAAKTIPQRLNAADAEMRAARDYVEQWRGLAAKPEEYAKTFAGLSQLLKQSGATPTMFRPESKQIWTELERMPLTIGCRGRYEQVYALINGIERVPRRIWIEEATIEKSRQDAELVDCELRLAIFADKFEISN